MEQLRTKKSNNAHLISAKYHFLPLLKFHCLEEALTREEEHSLWLTTHTLGETRGGMQYFSDTLCALQ